MLSSLDQADLGALDQPDMLGTADAQDPLSAIQSDLNLPVTSPASSARLPMAEPNEPASGPGGVKSVGLPIIIGVGGGLVLVLIVIMLFMFGGSDEPDPGPPIDPDGSLVQKPEDQPKPDEPDGQKPVTHEPEAKKPTTEPKQTVTAEKKTDNEKNSGGKKKTQATKQPQKKDVTKPPDEPKVTPKKDDTTSKDTVVAHVDPTPKEPEVGPPSNEDLKRMFAGIKEISLALPPMPTNAKTQSKKPDQQAMFDSGVRNIVASKFSAVAKRLRLSFVQTEDAVLQVKWDFRQEGEYGILDMSGELKCRAADRNLYTVWTHQQELFRVKRGANVNVEALLKDGIDDFFKPLQADYRKAGK